MDQLCRLLLAADTYQVILLRNHCLAGLAQLLFSLAAARAGCTLCLLCPLHLCNSRQPLFRPGSLLNAGDATATIMGA